MKSFKQYFLEQAEDSIAILPGGFKPPTKGHFNAFNYLLQDASRGIICVGNKDREGITAEMSQQIWKVYSKYFNKPVEVIMSSSSPVRSVYDIAIANPDTKIYVGAGSKDEKDDRFTSFTKNIEKYPLVNIVHIPMQSEGISGTLTRQKIQTNIDDALDYFLPDAVKSNKQDVLRIKSILLNK